MSGIPGLDEGLADAQEALAAVVKPLSPADRSTLVQAKRQLLAGHLASALAELLEAAKVTVVIAALEGGDMVDAAARVDDMWRALRALLHVPSEEAS